MTSASTWGGGVATVTLCSYPVQFSIMQYLHKRSTRNSELQQVGGWVVVVTIAADGRVLVITIAAAGRVVVETSAAAGWVVVITIAAAGRVVVIMIAVDILVIMTRKIISHYCVMKKIKLQTTKQTFTLT